MTNLDATRAFGERPEEGAAGFPRAAAPGEWFGACRRGAEGFWGAENSSKFAEVLKQAGSEQRVQVPNAKRNNTGPDVGDEVSSGAGRAGGNPRTQGQQRPPWLGGPAETNGTAPPVKPGRGWIAGQAPAHQQGNASGSNAIRGPAQDAPRRTIRSESNAVSSQSPEVNSQGGVAELPADRMPSHAAPLSACTGQKMATAGDAGLAIPETGHQETVVRATAHSLSSAPMERHENKTAKAVASQAAPVPGNGDVWSANSILQAAAPVNAVPDAVELRTAPNDDQEPKPSLLSGAAPDAMQPSKAPDSVRPSVTPVVPSRARNAGSKSAVDPQDEPEIKSNENAEIALPTASAGHLEDIAVGTKTISLEKPGSIFGVPRAKTKEPGDAAPGSQREAPDANAAGRGAGVLAAKAAALWEGQEDSGGTLPVEAGIPGASAAGMGHAEMFGERDAALRSRSVKAGVSSDAALRANPPLAPVAGQETHVQGQFSIGDREGAGSGEIDGNLAKSTPGPAAGATGQETFAALDASPGMPRWVHSGSRSAEAGFSDPALGWVGVRAGLSGGAIHAAVVPGSVEAAQVLSTHLPGLETYLQRQHAPLASLTIAGPEPGESGFTAGQSREQYAQEQGGQGGSASFSEAGQSDRTAGSHPAPGKRTAAGGAIDPVVLTGSLRGTHISVVA